MENAPVCANCDSEYGHGPDDCPICRSARRKDILIRVVIGLMFIVPMLTLFATILLDSGVGQKIFQLD
ncbi:hypothetical protein [Azospirillum sp. sgz302134]